MSIRVIGRKIRPKGLVFIDTLMEQYILVNGQMINRKEEE